jgi:two-component system LytT family sensor kinase
MILKQYNNKQAKAFFSVPARVIWFSALFMGILASIPKILQLQITAIELSVDSSIAFLFSLFVWYYNIYSLPKFSNQQVTNRFFNFRLLRSLLLGAGLMIILVIGHQFLFPKYKFQSMMMMYEFRGILINLTIYMFLYLLYQSYRTQMIGVELEKVKADNLSAQYELLKQQVNPHFLFNSLNTLKSMVEIGDQHAVDFIIKLSDFYRFTLENRKQDIIPLHEELTILSAYMFLLRARFEDGINLTSQISQAESLTYIPPFTLQLLVENCIKHNVVSLERPLLIKLYTAGGMLIVENQLQLKNVSETSTAMGLENINERYLHFAQRKIEIEKDKTSFKIKLPLIYEYSHH